MDDAMLYRLDLDHEHFRWASGLPEWLVPFEPDYEAIAERMPELIDIAAYWTKDNRVKLAQQLWAAGCNRSVSNVSEWTPDISETAIMKPNGYTGGEMTGYTYRIHGVGEETP